MPIISSYEYNTMKTQIDHYKKKAEEYDGLLRTASSLPAMIIGDCVLVSQSFMLNHFGHVSTLEDQI